MIEKKEDPKWIYEFSSLWAQLQSQASLTRFDMEEITITGATLRRLMQQSARFGIENYQRLEEQCVKVRLHILIWIIYTGLLKIGNRMCNEFW